MTVGLPPALAGVLRRAAGGADPERRLRIALSRVLEPDLAPDPLSWLCMQVGVPAAVDALLSARLPELPEQSRRPEHALRVVVAAAAVRATRLDVDAELCRTAREGARVVVPGDPEWPSGLDELPRPPFALWARGAAGLADVVERAVAVVGTRASTSYGDHVAADLAAGLAERDWATVSGAAFGIDSQAHRGSLGGGGRTVAVLAGGVDVPYPRAHHRLLERITMQGVVVSEQPMGSAPMRFRFLMRNRLVAALGKGTVVVEAGVRSGARSTAARAFELNRPVMAVPGPVTSPMSAGCHALLRAAEPAVCVTSAAEVLDVVGRLGDDLAPVLTGEPVPRDELSPAQRRVLDAVPVQRPAVPARVAELAGLDAAATRAALTVLELAGWVERLDDGYRLGAGARAGRRAAREGSAARPA